MISKFEGLWANVELKIIHEEVPEIIKLKDNETKITDKNNEEKEDDYLYILMVLVVLGVIVGLLNHSRKKNR